MNTKRIGDLSVSNFISRCIQNNISVSVPFGDRDRYDLIIDFTGKLKRVQVKTGHVENGVIVFYTNSIVSKAGRRIVKRNYINDVDFFGIYVPELEECFLVPVRDVGTDKGFLRINEPKNKQVKKIKFARDYKF